MKKLLAALALVAGASSANAGLFITNNAGCDLGVQLTAHDVNHPAACSYYVFVEIPRNTARAYNNVTELNNGWQLNQTGIPNYANMTATGSGWDAAWVYSSPYFIGNPGTCAAATTLSYTDNWGCTYNASWTNLGGNNVLLELNP
ncbi:hypothetical protein [Taibaiella chishuiensis]|uniref:Uncharacterized protein n=1 Tax=Taibaiella chishuiensis TaxID=1434707 RepID=A0A2P8CXW4_9BACT|nr:hypothetical protein [Taibaiella chishuiensis]PSK89808.1 hypothetical protein B0I18_110109 [Taibaiella chishuiensis]